MNKNWKSSQWLKLILRITLAIILTTAGFYIWNFYFGQKARIPDGSEYTNTVVAQWGKDNNEWINNKFGFKLKFSDSWQGFQIIENAAVFDNATSSYSLSLPEQSNLLNISVYALNDWNTNSQEQLIYPEKKMIGQTDKYVIGYRFYNTVGSKTKNKYQNLIPELIKTYDTI